ncbi:MAG: hypothetical protein QF664_09400 [Dehalococcoidia bacterium]|jgi:hypothetical protein|nr:hypothetical protein [Dehalococcoidia bacterium]
MPRLWRVITPVAGIDRAQAFYTSLLGMPADPFGNQPCFVEQGTEVTSGFVP